MITSLVAMQGVSVGAGDDEIGTVARFLVDLERWTVTHIVVTTGSWLDQHEVLISPSMVVDSTDDRYGLMLSTSRDHIREAATIISPRARSASSDGAPVISQAVAAGIADSSEVLGAHLEASDGPIGHLDDLLIDRDTWRARYVVVDPRNWWLGKHVLISPEWIDRFDLDHHKVHVNVERDAIKSAPGYDAGYVLTRDDEAAMFRHYNRRPYWAA